MDEARLDVLEAATRRSAPNCPMVCLEEALMHSKQKTIPIVRGFNTRKTNMRVSGDFR
jgi:hypothetical protein